MMRLIDSAAELVCSVASTRWPVSAMVSAACDRLEVAHLADQDDVGVLAQRVLERRRRSSSCRCPTSRWLTMQLWWRWMNSIGSSTVMMWPFRSLLILSIIAASVVDLPEPVGPGHQDQAARPLGQLRDHRRQAQLLEGLDVEGDLPDDHRHAAALLEDVAAEARQVLDAEGEVELVLGLEALLLVLGEHRVGQLQRVLRRAGRPRTLALVMSPSMRSFGRSPAVMCRSEASRSIISSSSDPQVDASSLRVSFTTSSRVVTPVRDLHHAVHAQGEHALRDRLRPAARPPSRPRRIMPAQRRR